MDNQQVVEIQVPSEVRKEQITKLVEVCWTRPIEVDTQDKMYLAGTRFLFELPVPGQPRNFANATISAFGTSVV